MHIFRGATSLVPMLLPIVSIVAGTACVEEVAPVETVEIATKKIVRAEGGEMTSPSGDINILFPPRVFIADAQITVIESEATDLGNAALSSRIAISASAESAISFLATLTFRNVDVSNIAPDNLVLTLGGPPYETFRTAVVDDDGDVVVDVANLGTFVLIDRGALLGQAEPEGEPAVGPEGEPAVSPGAEPEGGPQVFGTCSESCLAESDAPCCAGCGCGSGTCTPVCDSGFRWDCELECCFDSESTSCVE